MAQRLSDIWIFVDSTERDLISGAGAVARDGDFCILESDGSGYTFDGTNWNRFGTGASGYTATTEGQILYSQNGSTFAAEEPMCSTDGWLVNADGILLIL